MDFVNDTPTSEYGLALDLMGRNYGYKWDRVHGLVANSKQDIHSYMYFDANGYNNSTFWDMPGDVRDYGEF